MDQTKDLRDELVNENLDSYRKFQRRKSSIIKTKFIKKAEYLKSYIDKMNKIEKSSIFLIFFPHFYGTIYMFTN
jgi:type III secretory pathway component EscR